MDNNETSEDLLEDEPIDNAFSGVRIESTTKLTTQASESKENVSIYQQEDEEQEEKKLLNLENINPTLKALKYKALGPIETRAAELEEILNDDDDYDFDHVIRANDDDAQACGQKPLTFLRKVLAIVCYPKLLADNSFPEDTKARARRILKGCRGNSIGSVTDPAGIETIRRDVAKYLETRDSVRGKWHDVILTAGVSEAMKGVMKLIACNVNGKRPGIMLPMPTRQLYRTYAQKYNMYQIGYYLDEENNWSIETEELNRAYNAALSECSPRALIVINPGNPTGQILNRENIEEIIKFAYNNQLLICADESNQFDIFIDEIEFTSFKKVLKELGYPYSKMELASFASASSGYIGEGGLRGGYVEFINVAPDVKKMFLKYISIKICPPVLGQVAIEVMVNPPLPEEPSYDEYMTEKEDIFHLHKIQATMATIAFNTFTNFSCTPIIAGRHAFPRISIPQTAIDAAAEVDQPPDFYFATQLLEQKGICVSPGCESGQKEDTYHLNIALVLPPDDLNFMLGRFKQFNQRFNETYSCKCKKKQAPGD